MENAKLFLLPPVLQFLATLDIYALAKVSALKTWLVSVSQLEIALVIKFALEVDAKRLNVILQLTPPKFCLSAMAINASITIVRIPITIDKSRIHLLK